MVSRRIASAAARSMVFSSSALVAVKAENGRKKSGFVFAAMMVGIETIASQLIDIHKRRFRVGQFHNDYFAAVDRFCQMIPNLLFS